MTGGKERVSKKNLKNGEKFKKWDMKKGRKRKRQKKEEKKN